MTMQCKACSTRINPGQSVCPNCGRTTGQTLAAKPAGSQKKAKQSAQGKSNAPRKPSAQSNTTVQRRAAAPDKPRNRPQEPKAIDLELEHIAEPAMEDSTQEVADTMGVSEGLVPKPAELRALLAENPELLEPGLGLLSGSEGGVGYPTDVGEIDLLMIDEAGDLVVVSLPDLGSSSDPVSDMLQRIGWVRKHVGEGKNEVRGIVLLASPPEDLSYAAAAVSGTVAFRTYRMSISFEDLEF